MPEERYTAEEQALFDLEFQKKLASELPNVREEEIKAAAQRAAELELEQQREAISEQLDSEVASATIESARDARAEANREAPSKLVVGLVLLLLLLFLWAVMRGGLPGLGLGNPGANSTTNSAAQSLTPVLDGPRATPIGGDVNSINTAGDQTGRGLPNAGAEVVPTVASGIDPNVSQVFAPFYLQHDGLRLFGRSISPLLEVNGRQVQWFERTRLEHWPEYAGTPYEVQSGLVGLEYTDERDFPKQSFFINRPGLWFFGETSHGVRGKFLDYWMAHGGLDLLGYPISDEVVEILPETQRYHTVQYFQRGRLELHPEHAGTEDEVQLGLLGRALYLNEEKSTPVQPLAPTPVPLP
ncbi:MAG TPA: hypothetical protein VGD69_08540 [Herpetosiphonaceae bacterium]